MRNIVGRAGRQVGLAFPVHAQMLRPATGYILANAGQDTRAIQPTSQYMELVPERFKDFGWD